MDLHLISRMIIAGAILHNICLLDEDDNEEEYPSEPRENEPDEDVSAVTDESGVDKRARVCLDLWESHNRNHTVQ